VKQAKSKQKILDKMVEAGLTQPVQKEHTFAFQFPGALTAILVLRGCHFQLRRRVCGHELVHAPMLQCC
jgi:hypothetical protein